MNFSSDKKVIELAVIKLIMLDSFFAVCRLTIKEEFNHKLRRRRPLANMLGSDVTRSGVKTIYSNFFKSTILKLEYLYSVIFFRFYIIIIN